MEFGKNLVGFWTYSTNYMGVSCFVLYCSTLTEACFWLSSPLRGWFPSLKLDLFDINGYFSIKFGQNNTVNKIQSNIQEPKQVEIIISTLVSSIYNLYPKFVHIFPHKQTQIFGRKLFLTEFADEKTTISSMTIDTG